MAARGAESKSIITQKILDTFEGAFLYDKEIRIPVNEAGEVLQIKCVLTCAKTNVDGGNAVSTNIISSSSSDSPSQSMKLTEEEKDEVNNLIQKLGL